MLKKDEIKEIIKIGLILFIITAISAGLLAIVNLKTKPIIDKNQNATQQEAMKVVLPDANSFEMTNLKSGKMDNTVTAVYKASDSSGYVVMVSPVGYGGPISLAVGVSSLGKVSGVRVISQAETAGLGSKCTSDDFSMQYIGKSENITVAKHDAKENQINAISSATITSKAVTSGVNSAIDAAKMAQEAQR